MRPWKVPCSAVHKRVPRCRHTLWNACNEPLSARTISTLAPATSRRTNAPRACNSPSRPAASHIRAKTASISRWNHAGSVYASAGSVVRSVFAAVVPMADS
jgi:hypothetical protein